MGLPRSCSVFSLEWAADWSCVLSPQRLAGISYLRYHVLSLSFQQLVKHLHELGWCSLCVASCEQTYSNCLPRQRTGKALSTSNHKHVTCFCKFFQFLSLQIDSGSWVSIFASIDSILCFFQSTWDMALTNPISTGTTLSPPMIEDPGFNSTTVLGCSDIAMW